MAVVVSRTAGAAGRDSRSIPLSSVYCIPSGKAQQHGEKYGLMVTAPNLHRAIERGVTDINYYNNSGMNALEDLGAKFVDLDGKADFIGKDALRRIRDQEWRDNPWG